MTEPSYDYVIVGAGSSGSVLANRLTEDLDVRVLLLEAGPVDDLQYIDVPVGFAQLFGSEVDWDYQIEPSANYQGPLVWPRGKTLGGSSSINLMVYVRGNRADYDNWSATGATGWDYESVLPYFTKAENNNRLRGPLHGTTGPQHVEDRRYTHELSSAWVQSAVDWGMPANDDFNGESQHGAGAYQVTCYLGHRWSTARGYLRPAMSRPNLTVLVGAQATRIVVEGGRATGVIYRFQDQDLLVRADREVLLSGGVINSPQLLMLSGIGPADHLRSHGIDVKADLPGVGANLHDHTMVPLVWATHGSTDLLDLATPENLHAWMESGMGPFSSNASEVGGFLSVENDDSRDGSPDVQFSSGPTGFVHLGRYPTPRPSFTTNVSGTRPLSRGKLWLRSADPFEHPHIDPNYFAEPNDLKVIAAGIRAALEIAAVGPQAKYLGDLRLPLDAHPSESDLFTYARTWASTEFHPVGTCAMGQDDNAVVDPELRVRGVDGLRVVDASVMPSVPSGNLNAAAIMIGEKAADLIKNARVPMSGS